MVIQHYIGFALHRRIMGWLQAVYKKVAGVA